MTPTEQDKELREQLQGISYKAVVSAYNTSLAGLIDYAHELTEELMQLITADRKKHELQAKLELVQKINQHYDKGGLALYEDKGFMMYADTLERDIKQELEKL